MPQPSHPAPRERLALLALLALAAVLRVLDLDVSPGFSGDEGLDHFHSWQLAEHQVLRLHPVRPYLGPWSLWLTAPAIALLGPSPLAARLPVALLGVLAVALAWAIGRRLSGPRAGLAAAALMATAPFAVLFSRLSLAVGSIPFWTLLTLLALLRLLDRATPGRALAFGLALGGAVSFHPQGLLLGPVSVGLALCLPQGRALAKPRLLLPAAVGFFALAWTVWPMILDQVGLGPGIDYSGTWVGQPVSYSLPERLLRSFPQMLDGLVGGRILLWVTGPSWQDPPLEPVAAALALALVALALRAAARPQHRLAAALLLGVGIAWGLTVLRSADFDLGTVTRERYTLTTLTLAIPLLGLAIESLPRRLGPAAIGALAALNLLALTWGFFLPMARHGGDSEPSFRAARPDAKLQAADWMLSRLGPEEPGLLLAGDGWSYWPIVALSEERFAADFVPEDPAECAAILTRTDHRRRWLVDYPGWHWNAAIQRCLAAVNLPELAPAFAPVTVGGAPALLVWELPPGALRAVAPPAQRDSIIPLVPPTPSPESP